MKEKESKEGSHKNIWYGTGRQRIEIPKTILKSRVQGNSLLKHLHICSIGYYPRAKDHYTYRKKGLAENFLFYCVVGSGWYQIEEHRYEVGPNEFFILTPNKEHAVRAITFEEPLRMPRPNRMPKAQPAAAGAMTLA